MNNIGLYLHIPFCKTKCPYCDFYSMRGNESDKNMYMISLVESMEAWSDRLERKADTIYIGGGTPSVLGGANIAMLIRRAKIFSALTEKLRLNVTPRRLRRIFLKQLPMPELTEFLLAFNR